MKATIGGAVVTLTASGVEEALRRIEPESVRDLYVVVAGRRFPVKQALEAATGIDRSDFTSHQARALFRRLGLELGRAENRVGESVPPYGGQSEGVISDDPFEWLTEDQLRAYDGQWIAVRGREVVASADSPEGIVQALRQRGERADVMVGLTGGGDTEIPGADL